MRVFSLATRLVLVRHGQARAGVDDIIGGPTGCKGLTDEGRDQAERLRLRVARDPEFPPDVVLASTLPRAIETAEIVRAGFSDAPELVTDCDYCELHPGECDGLTIEEYTARYGDIDNPDPDRPMSPGGESPRAFDTRVRKATAGIVERYENQTVWLFTHGGFVTAATLYLLGAPGIYEAGSFWLPPKNTSLNVLVSEGEGWGLERYSDAAHLLPG
jgi:broad specificity phosphatase PhoE